MCLAVAPHMFPRLLTRVLFSFVDFVCCLGVRMRVGVSVCIGFVRFSFRLALFHLPYATRAIHVCAYVLANVQPINEQSRTYTHTSTYERACTLTHLPIDK